MPYYITDQSDDCPDWAVVKEDGEVVACHATKDEAIAQMVAASISEGIEPGGERAEDLPSRPAPPEDQIEGSDKNEPGSASGAGGKITLSEQVETALRNKVAEHNEKMGEDDRPRWTRTTYGQLAAVYRRGAGAYSSSHRPGISRGAWAMARVNAYLYLLRNGKPQNANYVTDNDLLPEGHPKSTRSIEDRQVELDLPGYMRDAARQGLKWHEEGLSGDGIVPATVRDARAMTEGRITEQKVIRASAWAARHRVDLDRTGAKPGQENFPTPGAVAHYLWGIPTGERYADAVAWFDRKSEQIKRERTVVEITPVKPRSEGSGVEFRSTTGELRSESDGRFVGYAAVFNSASQPLPFVERIAPGAFARSLRNRKSDIRLYVNHNSDMPLASRRSGTLELSEDDHGLRVEAELPDTSYARDLRELMATGVVDRMSFGFSVAKGGDRWSDDGGERTLTAVTLHEVSVVTGFPAYEATSAALRSLDNLARRTALGYDELVDALDTLANGDPLDDERANAIASLLQRQDADATNLLALKSRQTDLLAKKIV
jgi:HK97 family phage prohead protease